MLCFVDSSSPGLFDVRLDVLRSSFRYDGKRGPWHVCSLVHEGRHLQFHFYRYRVIVIYQPVVPAEIGTDRFIRDHWQPFRVSSGPVVLSCLAELFGENVSAVYSYYLVVADDYRLVRRRDERLSGSPGISWLDEGAMTHMYRVFDGSRGRVGHIRVSKWLAVSYGLSESINRELVNLIYEKVIHAMRRRGRNQVVMGEDELALLDGLARYTVPTELNIFLQRLVLAVTLALSLVGVVLTIIGQVISELDALWKALFYGALFALGFLVFRSRLGRVLRPDTRSS